MVSFVKDRGSNSESNFADKPKQSKTTSDKHKLARILAKIPFISIILIILFRFAFPATAIPVLSSYMTVLGLYAAMTVIRSMWTAFSFVYWAKKQANITSQTQEDDEEQNPAQLVIITNYKEPLEVIIETLNVLARTQQASRMTILLAMEKRDPNHSEKARILSEQFSPCFAEVLASVHPFIPEETPGKGSNIAWAFKTFAMDSTSKRKWDLVHILDVDTHHNPEYYNRIEFYWRKASREDREKLLFACPVRFDRNSDEVAWPVRMIDAFWSLMGISALYPGSSAIIPTSTYTISCGLAKRIGGWDADEFGIGEDFHIMVKSFYESRGDIVMQPIYTPARQLHVTQERVSVKGWLGDVLARYDQSVRHLWGTLDLAYTFEKFVQDPKLLLKISTWTVLLRVIEPSLVFTHSYCISYLLLIGTSTFTKALMFTWLNGVWMIACYLIYQFRVERYWGKELNVKALLYDIVGLALFGPFIGVFYNLVPLYYAQFRHVFNVRFSGWSVQSTPKPEASQPPQLITAESTSYDD